MLLKFGQHLPSPQIAPQKYKKHSINHAYDITNCTFSSFPYHP